MAFLLTLAFLLFRFWLLPNLDQFRPRLIEMVSQQTGMAVKVGRISARWQWLAPVFHLEQVSLQPSTLAPPIRVRDVQLQPAWKSLLLMEPRFSRVEVSGLSLSLERTPRNRLLLNGIDLSAGSGDGAGVDWLLRQDDVSIALHQFVWRDQLLALPPLVTRHMQARLEDGLLGHALRIEALPEGTGLKQLLVTAHWRGARLADWPEWSGGLTVQADAASLGWAQRYLPALPLSIGGGASSSLQLSFAEGRVTRLNGRWQLQQAALSMAGQAVQVPQFAGEIDYRSDEAGQHQLQASRLMLATRNGQLLRNGTVTARWHARNGGYIAVDRVSAAALLPLIQQQWPDLPPEDALAIEGELQGLRWQWQGPVLHPTDYRLRAAFAGMGMRWQPHMQWSPSLQGSLLLTPKQGQLSLRSGAATIQLPGQLSVPVVLQSLSSDLNWQREATGWRLMIPGASLVASVMGAKLSGNLFWPDEGAVQSHLQLEGGPADVARVPDYLPKVIGADTVAWLQSALRGGRALGVHASLDGELSRFPFSGGEGGKFDLSVPVVDGVLRFDTAWPEIGGIRGRYYMRNNELGVQADAATTHGVRLSGVNVAIPDYAAAQPVLDVKGKAAGPLASMLGYTVASPVDRWLGSFLSTIDAKGAANLQLALSIPLAEQTATRVKGHLQFDENAVRFGNVPLPTLAGVRGGLDFTEHGIASTGIDYQLFGGRGRLVAVTDAHKRMVFDAAGDLSLGLVNQQYLPFLNRFAQGQTDYRARFQVGSELDWLTVQSSLQGIEANVPAPLRKVAADNWPFELTLRPAPSGWTIDWAQQARASGKVVLGADGQLRGASVAVGGAAPMPGPEVAVYARLPEVDVSAWVQSAISGGEGQGGLPLPLRVSGDIGRVGIAGRVLHNVQGQLDWEGSAGAPLHLQVKSEEMAGQASYQADQGGRLQATLERLAWPWQEVATSSAVEGDLPLPSLNVTVQQLVLAGKPLGKLILRAKHQPQLWLLEDVSLEVPEGVLRGRVAAPEGSGTAGRRTEASFDLRTRDAGALLERLGIKDAVRGGEGGLSGAVQWLGGLGAFDLARLSGNVVLDVRKGRFVQVDTGAARLLGLLSLQSLSRRIRLDFTDVFSSGFAFDTLNGSAEIDAGVFRSRDFVMQGPAAKVAMRGEADLANNRQQLLVQITPTLSESVALITGATLVNPLAGALALAAQKVLQDPVGRILSFEYEVSGSLAEPQVRKLGQREQTAPAGPKP